MLGQIARDNLAFSPFVPDMLLPEQVAPSPWWPPEKRLAAAVLVDAIETYRVYRGHKTTRGRMLAQDARQWIEADGPGVYGIEWVCDKLGVDVPRLRAAVLCSNDEEPSRDGYGIRRTGLVNDVRRALDRLPETFSPADVRDAVSLTHTRNSQRKIATVICDLVRTGELERVGVALYRRGDGKPVSTAPRDGGQSRSLIRERVRRFVAGRIEFSTGVLHDAAGLRTESERGSAQNVLREMIREGWVRRVGFGVYAVVNRERIAEAANG